MDLRLRFGTEPREYDDRTCIIIVHVENTSIGFIVDTVSEVKDIRESDIDPPPSFKKHVAGDRYISGLGKADEEMRILLDVKKILERDEDLKLESIGSEK